MSKITIRNLGILILTVLGASAFAAVPWFPEDWHRIDLRLQQNDYSVLDELKQANRVEELYVVLRECGWKQFGDSTANIASATRERLAEISGHAIAIGDKVDRLTEKKDHNGERSVLLNKLQGAKTPEAIAQLGRFLYDERNPDLEDPRLRLASGKPYPQTNSEQVAGKLIAIMKLPLGKPYFDPAVEIPRVQAWWESDKGKPYRDLLAASGRGYAGQNAAAPTPAPPSLPSATPPEPSPPLPLASSPPAMASPAGRIDWKWWVAGIALLLALAAAWKLLKQRQ